MIDNPGCFSFFFWRLHVLSLVYIFKLHVSLTPKNCYYMQSSKMTLKSMFSRSWSMWALNCGRYFCFFPYKWFIILMELWLWLSKLHEFCQVKSGTLFDNVLICDDPDYAMKLVEATWGKQKDVCCLLPLKSKFWYYFLFIIAVI